MHPSIHPSTHACMHALHYITLHYITVQYSTLPTLHYNTLHSITYIHMYLHMYTCIQYICCQHARIHPSQPSKDLTRGSLQRRASLPGWTCSLRARTMVGAKKEASTSLFTSMMQGFSGIVWLSLMIILSPGIPWAKRICWWTIYPAILSGFFVPPKVGIIRLSKTWSVDLALSPVSRCHVEQLFILAVVYASEINGNCVKIDEQIRITSCPTTIRSFLQTWKLI